MKSRIISDSHKRCSLLDIGDIKENNLVEKQQNEIDKLLLYYTDKCLKRAKTTFFSLYNSFFTLTGNDLVVLNCLLNKNSNKDLSKYIPARGTSLEEVHFGTNAISLASMKRDVSYVVRDEHYCHKSKDLTCVASPIRLKKDIIGYIGVSTVNKGWVNPLRSFIEELAFNISNEINLHKVKEKIERYIKETSAFNNPLGKMTLSEKESEIIKYMLKGFTNDEIAQVLFITEATVKTHLRNIYEKNGTKNKVDTAIFLLCEDVLGSLSN